jgi:hypothetical protein
LAAVTAAYGAKKVISPTTSASNETVDIVATIVLNEEQVKEKIGADPGKGIVLLQVRVTPKTDQPVQVSPEDFILLAHDDGERSKPFTPEELAGNGAMVVSTTEKSGPKSKQSFGLGPIMGTGGGSSPGNSKQTVNTSRIDSRSKGNLELLKALQAKQFPTKDAKDEVEGLMYFPLDGKHKLKNLAVLYRGPAGKLDLEFEH